LPPTEIRTYRIPAGSTARLWLGVNVRGHLNLVIRSRDGNNRLTLWWIKQPFGRVEQLGERTGEAKLDIPTVWNMTVGAELRASAKSDTVVEVGENVEVTNSLTFGW